MNEEKFMRGCRKYRSLKGEDVPTKEWIYYITRDENYHLHLLVVGKKATLKQIRTEWRIKNSPLMKALE